MTTPQTAGAPTLRQALQEMVDIAKREDWWYVFPAETIKKVESALSAPGGEVKLPDPLEIHWPDLNPHALGCGVEDRGLHDRYECAEYGWQDGVDSAVECVPEDIYDADQLRAYGDARADAAAAPLLARIAELEKDAERYRWLRAGRYPYSLARSILNDTPAGIDASVDAARADNDAMDNLGENG